MDSPLVSVVIVTWNRREDVITTVQSVYDQAYPNVELVVVDNGSSDGTVAALRERYPEARLVALDRNTGAAAGRNAGIAIARGEIIFILDSDASLAHDTLAKIVGKFASAPDVGIIMCKILNSFTGQLDPHAGWIYPQNTLADQDSEFLSYSFSECGAAIRRQVFDRVGLFWDLLFFVGEGDELSLRAWDARFKILYWPQAIVYHRASPHKRTAYGDWQYYDLRNSLFIYLAHYPWWMLLVFAPLQIGVSLMKGVRRRCTRDVLRALADAARALPLVWRQRRPIRADTARYYLALQREHGPLSWELRAWLSSKV